MEGLLVTVPSGFSAVPFAFAAWDGGCQLHLSSLIAPCSLQCIWQAAHDLALPASLPCCLVLWLQLVASWFTHMTEARRGRQCLPALLTLSLPPKPRLRRSVLPKRCISRACTSRDTSVPSVYPQRSSGSQPIYYNPKQISRCSDIHRLVQ